MKIVLVKTITPVLMILLMALIPGCQNSNESSTQSTTTIPPTHPTHAIPTTTVPPMISAPPGYFYKAPIDIDRTSDGEVVHVNLVKFTGSIPSSDATILVNNNAVIVDHSGNYYAYLDLKKGQNIIEVKTVTGTETKTENIHIFFAPPLIIRLNTPHFDPNTDLKIPTPVTGIVSDPAAEVEVNGAKVDVNTDGTFVVQLQMVKGNNHVDAIAKLGSDTDEAHLSWVMWDNGQVGIVPGPTSIPYVLPTVTLRAGESTSFDFSLVFAKKIPDYSLNSVTITRTAKLNAERNSLPMLPELTVSVDPATYSTYPRIKHYSQVTIKTAPDLPPGEYFYHISPSLEAGFGDAYVYCTYDSLSVLTGRPKGADFTVSVR